MLAEATVALNDCTECESNFRIVIDLGGGSDTTWVSNNKKYEKWSDRSDLMIPDGRGEDESVELLTWSRVA